MNDSEYLTAIVLAGMIAAGAFFWGQSVGEHKFKKPCNQFAQWQYQQEVVPARCVK